MREWHDGHGRVGGAAAARATGLPTRSERPTTTASAPSSATSWRRSSSITPAGVHGRSPGGPSPAGRREIGVSPSTSLAGVDQLGQRAAVDLRRRRQLEQDAGHARIVVELVRSSRLDLGVRRRRRQAVVEAGDADLGATPSACRRRRPPTPGRPPPARWPGPGAALPVGDPRARPRARPRRAPAARSPCRRSSPAAISAASVPVASAAHARGSIAGGSRTMPASVTAHSAARIRYGTSSPALGELAAAGRADAVCRPHHAMFTSANAKPCSSAEPLRAVAELRHRGRPRACRSPATPAITSTPSTRRALRPRHERQHHRRAGEADDHRRHAADAIGHAPDRSGSRPPRARRRTGSTAAIATAAAPSSSSRSGASTLSVPKIRPGSVVSHIPRHVRSPRTAVSRSRRRAPVRAVPRACAAPTRRGRAAATGTRTRPPAHAPRGRAEHGPEERAGDRGGHRRTDHLAATLPRRCADQPAERARPRRGGPRRPAGSGRCRAPARSARTRTRRS